MLGKTLVAADLASPQEGLSSISKQVLQRNYFKQADSTYFSVLLSMWYVAERDSVHIYIIGYKLNKAKNALCN
jgi:hypothetical protein